MSDKVCITDYPFNAYADDVTVFCTSVPEFQRLIDKCVDYSLRVKVQIWFCENKMYGNIWKES